MKTYFSTLLMPPSQSHRRIGDTLFLLLFRICHHMLPHVISLARQYRSLAVSSTQVTNSSAQSALTLQQTTLPKRLRLYSSGRLSCASAVSLCSTVHLRDVPQSRCS